MGQFQNMAIVVCLKTLLFMYNIVFWVTGLLLLGLGIWAEFEMYKYFEMSPEFQGTGPLVIIGIGGLIILVGSIAFSCIIKGQPVLLYVYGGLMACIFMMLTGVGTSVVRHRNSFDAGLQAGLKQTLMHYNPEKHNFNDVQAKLKCCGVDNYTDWVRLSPQRVIPVSCCIDPHHCITANYSDVYQKGCYKAMTEFMANNTDILMGVATATALYPLLGTLLAFYLATYIQNHDYDAMI